MKPSVPYPQALTLELVARIRAGDQAAWTDLYSRYRDRLLFAVRCRLGAALRLRMESEDILQSVMLEALGELPTFVPRGADSLRHFLHVLITRKIQDRADTFGAAKRAGETSLDASGPLAARTETEVEYTDARRFVSLERAMARLPDDLREVVLLRKVDGRSSAEVAKRLGTTDDVVRKRTSRAMARLTRLALEEESTAP